MEIRTLGKIIIVFGLFQIILGLFSLTETPIGWYSLQSIMGFCYMCLGFIIINQDNNLRLRRR